MNNNTDSQKVLVLILRCETRKGDTNISHLQHVFSSDFFITEIFDINHTSENFLMFSALNYAAEKYNELPCILVKDSSISNVDPGVIPTTDGGMKNRIKVALEKSPSAGLYFLCKWQDACEKYRDVPNTEQLPKSSKLKWSLNPSSTQAIMYRPYCRDMIRGVLENTTIPLGDLLNNLVSSGKILANVFVSNIINFDIDLATSKDDYLKLNECSTSESNFLSKSSPSSPSTSSSSTSIIWLIIFIILALIIGFFLITYK